MKKLLFAVSIIPVLAFIFYACGKENTPKQESGDLKAGGCTTIQSGLIHSSDNLPIETGYDDWGYNYQAHIFNGLYCDSYHNAGWCQPYADVELIMKWLPIGLPRHVINEGDRPSVPVDRPTSDCR